MNLTIQKDTFAQGLNLVSRVVATRSTLPVLGNILIATDGQRLCLSATNLVQAITCWLDAEIEAEGRLTLPAKTLNEVVNATASGDSIAITQKDNRLTFKSSFSKTEINGIPADEFPILPRGKSLKGQKVEFEIPLLRDAIRKTVFCVATDDARPILQGVSLQLRETGCTLAATDGFRLSVVNLPISGKSLKALIPSETLLHLDRCLEESGSVVMRLHPKQGQVIFTTPEFELVSQLIEGVFPDYERIIPTGSTLTAEVNTAELLTAVKAVDIFAREAQHATRFTFEARQLRVLGQADELGSGQAHVSVKVPKASRSKLPFEIGLNARFILDALKAINGAPCTFVLNDPLKPAMLTPPSGDAFRMVIMPMRIGQ